MKLSISRTLSLIAGAFSALALNAVPAKPGLITMTQPDGAELKVRLTGDESFHQYFSEDGYPLLFSDGRLEYALIDKGGILIPSGIEAVPADARTADVSRMLQELDRSQVEAAVGRRAAAKKVRRAPQRVSGLFNEARFPSKGKQKALVVLVEYQDVKFTLSDPHDYFSRMLNEQGFSDYGATGSARDYFLHCSTGQFDPEFTLLGPVTLDNNMSYYGGNKANGDDRNPHRMAVEACQKLDAVVDFSEYDRDGDGFIDNIFIFYAGQGEASGGSENTVWPHTWYVTSAESTPYVFDGVTLDRYACANEWERGAPDGVGTFCHEFSHVLGLPDLYATSYSAAFTPGNWAVMDHGSYNNEGRTPPAYSSFERYALGWISPRVLDGPANVTLRDISSNTACIINTPDEDEFYLFEYRSGSGWDQYLPGHGMLAWHVHYDSTPWITNSVNNDPSHQYVDLIEADGIQDEDTRAGDAFPGTAGVTAFGDDTAPAMKTWCGATLGLPLTEITEKGLSLTFKVAGGLPELPAPASVEASDITPGGFTLAWEGVTGAESYEITLSSIVTGENGRPVMAQVEGYSPRNVGNQTRWIVEGLIPSTNYLVSVTAVAEGCVGLSAETSVTTLGATFEYLAPQGVAADGITENSFTARWNAVDGAAEYILDVYSYDYTDPLTTTMDFTGGISAMTTAGWTSDSRVTLSNAAYAGVGIPSLRLSSDGSYLDSPAVDGPVHSFGFWHRGVSASAGNQLEINALAGEQWVDCGTVAVSNAEGGVTTDIADLPAGTKAVRIRYSMPGKGSVAIDDIRITHGGNAVRVPHAGYDSRNVGAVLAHTVEGLRAGKSYGFRVCAVDPAGLRSRYSDEFTVVPAAAGSVEAVEIAKDASWTLVGRTLHINGDGAYRVCDIAGRVFSVGPAPEAVELPSAGVWIISIDGKTAKIAVR